MRNEMWLMSLAGAGLFAVVMMLSGCLCGGKSLAGKAPVFSAPAAGGKKVSLEDLRGKWVVLYFYPKADTPGCTKQACSLRDGIVDIEAAGAVIIGVSLDGVEKLDGFKAKYSLPFDLVSDSDKKISAAYGVLAPGGLFALRRTFIIDPKGSVAGVIDDVDVTAHSAQVLSVIRGGGRASGGESAK